jgi:methionyl aminopeptidase
MLGRNDPCWCGSGKKYKKCHLEQDVKSGNRPGSSRKNRYVKSAQEAEGMRRAGAFNAELLEFVKPLVKAGTATASIDEAVHEYTVRHGHTPASLGYHGFPKSCCTSINDIVCHGIPSAKETIREGDIVNVDLTTIVDGFYGDSSETFMIGRVSTPARHLVQVTARALLKGIEAVVPGAPLAAIAQVIEPYVRSQGCSVVQQYTGHGIGRKFHEGFSVLHHVTPDCEDIVMEPGMTFTIEPMINAGEYRVTTDPVDKWTVRTKDGSLSAQFEHTVLVTDVGAEVLTLTATQRARGVLLYVEGLDI